MIRQLSRFAISAVLVVGLQGCDDKKQEAGEQPARGLRAYRSPQRPKVAFATCAARSMSLVGTNRTSRDVRSLVAIGGKADMGWTAHFRRD